jgi:hypothetical protein
MKFDTLLKTTFQLIGGDSDEIDAPIFRFIRDAANHRLRLWWDAAQWPEAVKFEEVNITNKTYVPLDDIDALEVYDLDPRHDRRAQEIEFIQDDDGVHFLREYETAWLKYKLECPQFFGDPSTEETGTARYYDGDFRNNGNEIIPVPNRAFNYLSRAIYADYLRSNNQHEAAAAEESSAEGVLGIELDRFYSRKGQTPKLRIKTHG